MGYLGHVQRSRVLQLESLKALHASFEDSNDLNLGNVYRVVGDIGCQVSNEAAARVCTCLQRELTYDKLF
jgi:hypothetical protein